MKKVLVILLCIYSFSVYGQSLSSLSPTEMRNIGSSSLYAGTSHADFQVSTLNGSLSAYVTELALPGKAGLDVVLARRYNSGLAGERGIIASGATIADEDLLNQAEYAYSFGPGWVLDLPYLTTVPGEQMICLPGGSLIPISDFYVVSKDSNKVTLEYHNDSTDIALELTIAEFDKSYRISIGGIHAVDASTWYGIPEKSYKIESAILTTRDGTLFHFNTLGFLTKIEDAAKTKEISLHYDSVKPQLTYIEDTYNRKIHFTYLDGGQFNSYIDSISVEANGITTKKVQYSYNQITFTRNKTRQVVVGAERGHPIYETKTIAEEDTSNNSLLCEVQYYKDTNDSFSFLYSYAILDRPNAGYPVIAHNMTSTTVSAIDAKQISEAYPITSFTGPGVGFVEFDWNIRAYNAVSGVLEESLDLVNGFIESQVSRLIVTEVREKEFKDETEEYYKKTSYSYSTGTEEYQTGKFKWSVTDVYFKWIEVNDGRLETVYLNEAKAVPRFKSSFSGNSISNTFEGERLSILNEQIHYFPHPSTEFVKKIVKTYDKQERLIREAQILPRVYGTEPESAMEFMYDEWGNTFIVHTKSDIHNHSQEQLAVNVTKYVLDGGKIKLPDASSGYAQALNIPSPSLESVGLSSDTKLKSLNSYIDSASISETPRYNSVYYQFGYNYQPEGAAILVRNKYTYNAKGLLETVTAYETDAIDGLERSYVSTFTYDSENRITVSNSNDEVVSHFDYSKTADSYSVSEKMKSSAESQFITVTKKYDLATGLLIAITDQMNVRTAFTYDGLGRMRSQDLYKPVIKPISGEQGDNSTSNTISYNAKADLSESWVYSDSLRTVTHTAAAGQQTIETYTPRGELDSVVNNASGYYGIPVDYSLDNTFTPTASYTYNKYGQVATATINGQKTSIEYDSFGQEQQVTFDPDAGGLQITQQTHMDYKNNIRRSIDPMGVTVIEYLNFNGQVVKRSIASSEYGAPRLTEEFTYDGQGNLVLHENISGGISTISYTERGLPKEVVGVLDDLYSVAHGEYKAQLYTQFSYNAMGQAHTQITGERPVGDSSVDRELNRVVRQFDSMGRVTSERIGLEGNTRTQNYTYTNRSQISAVTFVHPDSTAVDSTQNKRISYTYDVLGLPKTESWVDDKGTSVIVSDNLYNKYGLLIQKKDAANNVTSFIYDKLNRLCQVQLPHFKTTNKNMYINYSYYADGRIHQQQGVDGAITKMLYDSVGRPNETTITGSDAITTFTKKVIYNDLGQVVNETTADGTTLFTNQYDDLNRLVETSYPEGNSVRYSYNAIGQLDKVIDGKENATEFLYNERGQRKSEIDARLNATQYLYNAFGGLSSYTSKNGLQYTYEFNNFGQVVKEHNPEGNSKSYTYNWLGQLESATDYNGVRREFSYNWQNKVDKILFKTNTAASGVEPVWVSDNSMTRTFDYDIVGSLKQAVDGNVTTRNNYVNGTYSPNPYGITQLQETLIDGKILDVNYNFNEKMQLESIVSPSDFAVKYAYDGLGRINGLSDITDSSNPIALTSGDFNYDPQTSAIKDFTRGNGIKTSFQYDRNGRLTELNHDRVSSSIGLDTGQIHGYTFGYDYNNNINSKHVFGQSAANTYSYDSLNRLEHSTEFGRFEIGLLEQLKTEVPESFQPVGSILDGAIGDPTADTFIPGDDILGEKRADFAGAAITQQKLDVNATSLVVDLGESQTVTRVEISALSGSEQVDRLKKGFFTVFLSDSNFEGSYTVVDSNSYNWSSTTDGVSLEFVVPEKGRYIKIHSEFNSRTIHNEPIDGHLIINPRIFVYSVADSRTDAYTYDENGNRNTHETRYGSFNDFVTYAYEEVSAGVYSDRIASDGHFGYRYDDNGNLLHKGLLNPARTGEMDRILIENDEYKRLVYDKADRLIAVYAYDVNAPEIVIDGNEKLRARLIASYTYDYRHYRVKASYNGSKPTKYYVFTDGGQCISELEGTDYTDYVYLFSQHFARMKDTNADGTRELIYYLNDHLGSTTMITDAEGRIEWQEELTSFGEVVDYKTSNDEYAKYTGKDFEEETGLYYFNARWYDPQLGRFISQDPIRDGLNWYTYCRNNPINMIDPTGLISGTSYTPQGASMGDRNEIGANHNGGIYYGGSVKKNGRTYNIDRNGNISYAVQGRDEDGMIALTKRINQDWGLNLNWESLADSNGVTDSKRTIYLNRTIITFDLSTAPDNDGGPGDEDGGNEPSITPAPDDGGEKTENNTSTPPEGLNKGGGRNKIGHIPNDIPGYNDLNTPVIALGLSVAGVPAGGSVELSGGVYLVPFNPSTNPFEAFKFQIAMISFFQKPNMLSLINLMNNAKHSGFYGDPSVGVGLGMTGAASVSISYFVNFKSFYGNFNKLGGSVTVGPNIGPLAAGLSLGGEFLMTGNLFSLMEGEGYGFGGISLSVGISIGSFAEGHNLHGFTHVAPFK